jgi:membrane protease YdiL (CAAX protease family)
MIAGAAPPWERWTIFQATLVFFFGLVGATVGVVLAGADPTDIEVLGFGLGGQVVAMGAALFGLSRSRGTGDVRADFGIRIVVRDAWTIVLGLGIQVVAILLAAAIAGLFDVQATEQEVVGLVDSASDGPARYFVVLLVVLAVPVLEEVVFRGMLLDAFRTRVSDKAAIGLSAGVFAGIHLIDPNAIFAVPGLFILGIVAGYFVVRDGHLSRAIFTHVGVNLTGAVLILLG